MAGIRIHTQHLILTGAGVRPTVPDPTFITPDDTRWNEDTDILKGELAYNETDDIWYTRTGGNVIKALAYAEVSNPVLEKLSVNEQEDTISYLREDGGTREFGKEISDSYVNLDTVSVLNGDVVSIVGASGNRSAIRLTDSNDRILSLATIGMVTVNQISVNGSGEVAKVGKVHDVNTSAYTEGTMLYVSKTNKGKLTNIKPTSGYVIQVGVVLVSHVNQGVIDLRISVIELPLVDQVFNGEFDLTTFYITTFREYTLNQALTPTLKAGTNLKQAYNSLIINAGASASLNTVNMGLPRPDSVEFTPNKVNEIFLYQDEVSAVNPTGIWHKIVLLN